MNKPTIDSITVYASGDSVYISMTQMDGQLIIKNANHFGWHFLLVCSQIELHILKLTS